MEGSKRHLRTGFADGLGGDYSCSFARLHQSTLVILYSLQHGLVYCRLGQLSVYQALPQLVEYQRRESTVCFVDLILNVFLGRGGPLFHCKPDAFYQSINVDSLAMIALRRVDTVFSVADLDYVASGVSDCRIVFYSEVFKGVDESSLHVSA